MAKIFSIIGAFIFISWFIHFDPDAYLEEQRQQASTSGESVQIEQSDLKTTDLVFPIENKSTADIVSGYGDPRDGGKRIHEGFDVMADRGTPVLAVADGKIQRVGNKGNAGKYIYLKSGDKTYFYVEERSYNTLLNNDKRI